MNHIDYHIEFLEKPVLITEQSWPIGTRPYVSISSLVYNHSAYLDTCISSLLKQKTTFPVEIVFHDDASNDGSTEIIRSYMNKYPHLIKLVLQEHNSFHHNIRKIENDLYRARLGKYIANCEGDDFWIDEYKLEKQVNFLDANNEFAGIHTNVQFVNSEGVEVGISNKVPLNLENAEFDDIVLNSIIHSVSFLYRNDVLLISGTPIWDLTKYYYDQYLFLVTALNGKIKYLNDITSAYRIEVGVHKTWNRFSKSLYTEDCIEFFEKIVTDSQHKIACHLKLKMVYATLYCCYAKSNDTLKGIYLKKYISTLFFLFKTLPFIKFLKVLFKVEKILLRGIFWHIVISFTRGRIRPKGLT